MFSKKSFGDQLKDTGFLLKNSFTVIGKDDDIKTPMIKMGVLSIIISTLFWLSVSTFFISAGAGIFGFLILLFTIFILLPFKSFFYVSERAKLSWIIYNTICGKDISYADAKNHIKGQKGRLRILAIVDIIISYVSRQKGGKGFVGILISIFLSFLREVWDLLNHYMLPAVVIEQKTLKEAVSNIKSLKDNVPATLAGVFGIDFAGDVLKRVMFPAYFLLLAIGVGVGYLVGLLTSLTVITVGSFSFSWVPVILSLWFAGIISSIITSLAESVKSIYFSIFYTSITRPMDITEGMRDDLTHYLLIDKTKFSGKSSSSQTSTQPQVSSQKTDSVSTSTTSSVDFSNDPLVNDLAKYVVNYRSQGKTDDEIKSFMKSRGYTDKYINQAIEVSKK